MHIQNEGGRHGMNDMGSQAYVQPPYSRIPGQAYKTEDIGPGQPAIHATQHMARLSYRQMGDPRAPRGKRMLSPTPRYDPEGERGRAVGPIYPTHTRN